MEKNQKQHSCWWVWCGHYIFVLCLWLCRVFSVLLSFCESNPRSETYQWARDVKTVKTVDNLHVWDQPKSIQCSSKSCAVRVCVCACVRACVHVSEWVSERERESVWQICVLTLSIVNSRPRFFEILLVTENSHTHTHTHARTHVHTHARTHTFMSMYWFGQRKKWRRNCPIKWELIENRSFRDLK